jgi:putative transposase
MNLTLAEIAQAVGLSKSAIKQRAAAEGWRYEEEILPTGNKVRRYELTEVTPAFQAKLILNAPPPAPLPSIAAPDLTGTQRRIMEMRLASLAHLDQLIAGGMSQNQAIKVFTEFAKKGELPPQLQQVLAVGNARSNGTCTVSARTLKRWLAERKKGATALAPRFRSEAPVPPWGAALLHLWARPQKPSLLAALEILAQEFSSPAELPSYAQARRFLKKMSIVDRNRGRMGPRELKKLRAFWRRDLSQFEPLDIGLMDGHQLHGEVAHPIHGKPFKPEMTTVIDAVTRKALSFSTGLAESAHAVMDALRHATVSHGVLAILYVDRGSGYHAAVISEESIGLLARVGTQHQESLPYNSQARGLMERAHPSIWVRGARNLMTYSGDDMDPEAAKKVHKLTRNVVQLAPRNVLMPWREFVAWAQAQVEAYNARPHRSLPKIRDEATGKLRHMSPNEAWDSWLARGWKPVTVSAHEAADLFRPVREVTTRRGEIALFNNIYFNRDLEHRHGERLLAGYDIHDPSRIWVRDLEGRLLCEAELDGNKTSFFPKSVVEQAREKRAEGRRRRLMIHLDEVEAELGPPAIDGAATSADLPAVPPPANDELEYDDAGNPHFKAGQDREFIDWCLKNRDRMNAAHHDELMAIMRSPTMRHLYGIDDATAASFGIWVSQQGGNGA